MLNYIPKRLKEWLKNEKLGFDELTPEEKDTFLSWQKILTDKPLTIDQQVISLQDMIDALILELVKIRTEDKNDIFLKARIENYLVMKSALTRDQKEKDKVNKLLER